MRILPALLMLLSAAIGAVAAEPEFFPAIKGRTLAGDERSTDALRGKPHLVAVGFARAHAPVLRRWAEGFRAAYPQPERADYLEIAAMDGVPSFLRAYITKQMTKDVPPAERGRLLVTFATDDLCRKLEIKNRKSVYVYLLNREGTIIERAQGDYDAEVMKRFERRLLEGANGSPAR
jgi:hypothetical protein